MYYPEHNSSDVGLCTKCGGTLSKGKKPGAWVVISFVISLLITVMMMSSMLTLHIDSDDGEPGSEIEFSASAVISLTGAVSDFLEPLIEEYGDSFIARLMPEKTRQIVEIQENVEFLETFFTVLIATSEFIMLVFMILLFSKNRFCALAGQLASLVIIGALCVILYISNTFSANLGDVLSFTGGGSGGNVTFKANFKLYLVMLLAALNFILITSKRKSFKN